MNLTKLQESLERNGFTYRYFATGREAADYIDQSIDGKTVGFGGSMTLKALDLPERLNKHNTVYSHWLEPGPETLDKAATAQVYLSSVNGIAETGEIINIDGAGNRVSATLFRKEKVIYVVGQNKIAEDYDKALWRARNIASPPNARRLEKKTPCALNEELKCYDCKSPERICRGLTVLWRKMTTVEVCEVIVVGEDLGY